MKPTFSIVLICLGLASPLYGAPLPVVATFENGRATLTIDAGGRIASLRSNASGRELLAHPQEVVSARLKDGRQIMASKASLRDGAIRFEFSGGQGAAVLAVDTRSDYFTFTIRSLSVSNVASLTFFSLSVTPVKYQGAMANMLSDDADAVCLRGYELPVEMSVGGTPPGLRVWTTVEHGLTGWRAGLAAGPKRDMPAMLRAMAVEAGVPISKLGGPWSLGAQTNRGSYLFANLSLASVDDWIELARRGGFTHLHLHAWWKTLGHYDVNESLYPKGLDDMKEAVARIHAAGLKAGIHTLTGCIDPRDAWVTPEASPHLIASRSYTLARSLTPTDTAIYVNEKPAADHDVIFSYMGNGNALRLGAEIVQYSQVVSQPPYAFSGCRRGAFQTRPANHEAGGPADYLQQRYIAFYPQPGSPLADDLAEHIAKVFNTCGLDQIYFDGSEGMMSRYGIDYMRHAIFKRLQGEVLAEASCHGAHNWWFHSRIGAWDHPVWAAKRFQDLHVASAASSRDADLLEPQMGWWAPRSDGPGPRPLSRRDGVFRREEPGPRRRHGHPGRKRLPPAPGIPRRKAVYRPGLVRRSAAGTLLRCGDHRPRGRARRRVPSTAGSRRRVAVHAREDGQPSHQLAGQGLGELGQPQSVRPAALGRADRGPLFGRSLR